MDGHVTSVKYDNQREKMLNQVWPKGISSGVANMKQSKLKHPEKHSIEINDGYHGYGSVNRYNRLQL